MSRSRPQYRRDRLVTSRASATFGGRLRGVVRSKAPSEETKRVLSVTSSLRQSVTELREAIRPPEPGQYCTLVHNHHGCPNHPI
jgi:hypothetical protein